MREYLAKITPHLCDMIYGFKESGEWKMQLTMKPNFISSTYDIEICTMYSKSNSRIVMIGNDMDEIIQELFDSLFYKYQIAL